MILRLSLSILFAALLLIGCGGPKTLNPEGEVFFKQNSPQYQLITLKAVSANETKSVESGYMPQDKVTGYMEQKVASLLAENSTGNSPVSVSIDLNYERVFSWGISSSLATIKYYADVTLKEGKGVLGVYKVGGNVADKSIAGDFKTMFADNKPKDENPYFDYIAQQIVEGLPKK